MGPGDLATPVPIRWARSENFRGDSEAVIAMQKKHFQLC